MIRRFVCLIFALAASEALSAQQAILRYQTLHHPVRATHGMVVSQRQLASEVGARVLADGGNAVDAAVATAFALAVVLPRAGNIAGGGFMLVHLADSGETIALDFREQAPAAASEDMFLGEDREVDQQRYRYSHMAAGVPGSVAGLELAWQKYGSLPWRRLLEPAVALAREGFAVTYDLASALDARRDRLTRHSYTKNLFFLPSGDVPEPGAVLRLPDLAWTLERIADQGRAGFYAGEVAQLLVEEMRRGGGLVTLEDLAQYQAVIRQPVRGEFMGFEVLSMPPPSSGGVHLVQMLNMLSHFPLRDFGPGSSRSLHVMAEVMKRAYADRSAHLGDPDFSDVPVTWLTSETYAASLAGRITMGKSTPSVDIRPGVAPVAESPDTTHLSVMDAQGNAVSLTTTLNFSFGSGLAVPGAGFLLNNEMTDFSAKPGTPDGFGLLTGKANAVAPRKRPLSAMTPTIVLDHGRPVLVTGSPGGSRIINTVMQTVVNVLAFGMNVAEANSQPRIHHQWMPDTLRYEAGTSSDALHRLASWGHNLTPSPTMGSVQSIGFDGVLFHGSADPRRPGAAAVGVPQ